MLLSWFTFSLQAMSPSTFFPSHNLGFFLQNTLPKSGCHFQKFIFNPTFIVCSPVCSDNCGVVFWWKYILIFEKLFLSFDRSNMQIFTVDFVWVVWPHVTIVLDLRHFCQHNPLFYHLNLILCHYWSWQRNIYFLVNIFVRHTFPMSKSSIKQRVTQLG